MLRTASILLLASSLAACGNSDSVPRDGGLDAGADGDVDLGASDADVDAGSDAGTPDMGGGCGALRPTITSISGTEGLVIARDGTIYYSQPAAIGRLQPDGTQDDMYVRLAGASTVWGLALDATNTHLYAGSPTTHVVYAIDLTSITPIVSTLVMGAGQPNGLTMGPDGAVYFTDFAAGTVQRADPAVGGATMVSMSTIPNANGLAFAPGDPTTLYVLGYGDGRLYALTLDAADHHESARRTVAMGLGSPDGITLDDAGNFYVTDNADGFVYSLAPDGTMRMTVRPGLSAPANLEFGTGPLVCHDLYVATDAVLIRIDASPRTGAVLPWH